MFQPPPFSSPEPGQMRINPLDLHRLTTPQFSQPGMPIHPQMMPPVFEEPLQSREEWTIIVGEMPSSGFVPRSQKRKVKQADGSILTTVIDADFLCKACEGKYEYRDIHGRCPGCGKTICRNCVRDLLDGRIGCRACVRKYETKDGQKGFVYSDREPKYLPVIKEVPDQEPIFTERQTRQATILAIVLVVGLSLLTLLRGQWWQ